MNQNKILLVEDNPEHADLTMMALKESDDKNIIYWVENGEDALDFVYQRGNFANKETFPLPDMIMLDIKLPKIDGIEVLKQIKSDPAVKMIPVIMFTTSCMEKEINLSYRLGANSFVMKPINFEKFLETVRYIETYWTEKNIMSSHQNNRVY